MTTNSQVLCTLLLCILSVHGNPICEKPANITDSNKYYVPPSETPNFTTLEDYRGQHIHGIWNIPNGRIDLEQKVTNAVQLSWWRRCTIAVTLRTYASGAIDQKWEFEGATIIFEYPASGAVYHMWNLGKKWHHYERKASGAKIREGNASVANLLQYQREIDSWCEANRRFFPTNCAIYDRF